jgi:hypothetical protein
MARRSRAALLSTPVAALPHQVHAPHHNATETTTATAAVATAALCTPAAAYATHHRDTTPATPVGRWEGGEIDPFSVHLLARVADDDLPQLLRCCLCSVDVAAPQVRQHRCQPLMLGRQYLRAGRACFHAVVLDVEIPRHQHVAADLSTEPSRQVPSAERKSVDDLQVGRPLGCYHLGRGARGAHADDSPEYQGHGRENCQRVHHCVSFRC